MRPTEPVDFIALLAAFASKKKKQVRDCQVFDPNVYFKERDPSVGSSVSDRSAYAFKHELRLNQRRRRVSIMASQYCIRLQVDGSLNVGVCSINREDRIMPADIRSDLRVLGDPRWPIFVTPALPRAGLLAFLNRPSVHAAATLLIHSPQDSVLVTQGSVCAYFCPGTAAEFQSAIDSLCGLVEPKGRRSRADLQPLPKEFQPLIPLILRWAEDDDGWRQEALRAASRPELKSLVSTVTPYLNAIDNYLTTNDDDAARALGRLAEFTVEARLDLERSENHGSPPLKIV